MTRIAMALILTYGVAAHAAGSCVTKTYNAPVVAVHDLHQAMDFPIVSGHCDNDHCTKEVTGIAHYQTDPRFEIVVLVKGHTYTFESAVQPQGSTVTVALERCGKTQKQDGVKPASVTYPNTVLRDSPGDWHVVRSEPRAAASQQ